MTRVRAAVVGATGYIGMVCTAILAEHPDVDLVAVSARSSAGRRHADVVPGSGVDLVLAAEVDAAAADVVMAALPHTVAAAQAQAWLDAGVTVVDMSADFRLRDVGVYERWYGVRHPAPELAARAVYALPELDGRDLAGAGIVAVPGCYPTAALLATVPALAAGLVEPDVVVDAKSGVSGAGRSASVGNLFAEVDGSVDAYGVAGHRHSAEMAQEMRRAAGAEVRLTFVPHRVPMSRGILATAYLRPRAGVSVADVEAAYRATCERHLFLRYDAAPPPTKSVTGTNTAALNVTAQGDMVVITCAIDNLVKGGAGQAVQAMNLRLGLAEGAGLRRFAAWP